MTPKVKVLRLVYHPHPAPVQLPQHPIMRNGLADHMQFLFGGWYVEDAVVNQARCPTGNLWVGCLLYPNVTSGLDRV